MHPFLYIINLDLDYVEIADFMNVLQDLNHDNLLADNFYEGYDEFNLFWIKMNDTHFMTKWTAESQSMIMLTVKCGELSKWISAPFFHAEIYRFGAKWNLFR